MFTYMVACTRTCACVRGCVRACEHACMCVRAIFYTLPPHTHNLTYSRYQSRYQSRYHVNNCSSCGNYSAIVVPHPSTILRGRSLRRMISTVYHPSTILRGRCISLSIHTSLYTQAYTHKPIHTSLCTQVYTHKSMHTSLCTQAYTNLYTQIYRNLQQHIPLASLFICSDTKLQIFNKIVKLYWYQMWGLGKNIKNNKMI